MDVLARGVDLSQKRHQVIASNIANVETPGYRARDIDFAKAMKEAVAASESGEPIGSATPVIDDVQAPVQTNGNTVDIDLQMSKLSENSDTYKVYARFLGHEFQELKMAIDKTQ